MTNQQDHDVVDNLAASVIDNHAWREWSDERITDTLVDAYVAHHWGEYTVDHDAVVVDTGAGVDEIEQAEAWAAGIIARERRRRATPPLL